MLLIVEQLSSYDKRILEYIKKLTPGTSLKISEIANNSEQFTASVKRIIDLRLTEVEFTTDYKYIIKREEVNYDKYRR